MQEIISIWKNTKMVVLIAVCAAFYASLMFPFKIITIIPGFTEVRPGVAIPVTCSFLFGPAAAWGAAIGNIIGDIWGGTISPGSFFGFFGNFLMAFIPYKFWSILIQKNDFRLDTFKSFAIFVLICVTASSACGVFIGWGLDILGFVPLRLLANIITLNNAIFTVILGAPLTTALFKRVKKWGLFYLDLDTMEAERPASVASKIGILLMLTGSLGGIIAVNLGCKNPFFSIFVILMIIASFLL